MAAATMQSKTMTATVLLTAALLLLAASVSADSGSGSTASCLESQYLDETGKCVDYENQGMKASADYGQAIDSGNTAWMLMSSALVMLMTPGVAFFYAGLAGEDMASNTMMMSFVSIALVTVQFWAFGYSASFGSHGIFGWAGYNNVGETPSGTYGTGIPHLLYAFFETQFAAVTPAELSGGIVGRMKFGTFLLFIFLWTSIVYDPLVYWIWSMKLDETWSVAALGWEGKMGALDFGGGTVIHVSAGFGALAAALMVGKRFNHGEPLKPHNVPLVLLGCTFLWFGWFGFNGGSAAAADGLAVAAALNTHLSASAGFLTWVILEYAVNRKIDPCGAACGAVAGMVTITPGSGYVYPWASLIFGVIGAMTGFGAVQVKNLLRYDDTLDVFAVHGCCGFVGGLLTGLFATSDVNPNIKGGAFYGHGMQFVYQLVAQCVAASYSFCVTMVILVVLKYTVGLRVSEDKEINGLDISYHGGLAYDYSNHGGSGDGSKHGANGVAMRPFKEPSGDFNSMESPAVVTEKAMMENV